MRLTWRFARGLTVALALAVTISATGLVAYTRLFSASGPDRPTGQTAANASPKVAVSKAAQTDSTLFLSAIADIQRRRVVASPPETGAGDERLPMASDLMHANKLAAATRLFQAIGADRLSHAPGDRLDALVAYRILGGIADTQQEALDAYARAIEIDPNDIESLLGSGWIVLQQGLLGEAERRLRRALPLLSGEAQPWNRFRLRLGLANIREQRGEFADALTLYRDALAIAEHATRSDPDDAWQRGLSAAYEKTGDVRVVLNNSREALDAYRDALEIAETLARADPGNAGWRRDVAEGQEKIGDARAAMGDTEQALAAYRIAIGMRDALAGAAPADIQRQHDLAAARTKAGDVLMIRGDLPAALKSYNDAFVIIDRLVQADTNNTDWLQDLATIYRKTGGVLAARDNGPGALKAYRDALAIADHIAKAEPSNEVWQHDLFVAYEAVGAILTAQGDRSGAANAYRAGLSIAEALAGADPEDAGRQGDLRDAYEKSGGALVAQDELPVAEGFFHEARAIAERLVQSDPGSNQRQRSLAVILIETGDVLVARGKVPNALQTYRDALAIIDRLVRSEPDNALWQQDALWINWRLATYDDDAFRRWTMIVASLRDADARKTLTAEQARWLPIAERQLAKLTPR